MKDDWQKTSSKSLSKDEQEAITDCYTNSLMYSILGAVPGYAFGFIFGNFHFSKNQKLKDLV
jgi:hypothetical protein